MLQRGPLRNDPLEKLDHAREGIMGGRASLAGLNAERQREPVGADRSPGCPLCTQLGAWDGRQRRGLAIDGGGLVSGKPHVGARAPVQSLDARRVGRCRREPRARSLSHRFEAQLLVELPGLGEQAIDFACRMTGLTCQLHDGGRFAQRRHAPTEQNGPGRERPQTHHRSRSSALPNARSMRAS